MFSQGHFRPLKDLPPQRSPSFPTNDTPSPSSALQTPPHGSPFDEGEDDFDLGDPHFNNSLSRSRTSSIRDRLDQHGSQQGGRGNISGGVPTFVRPEDIGGLLNSLSRDEEDPGRGDQDKENNPAIQVPAPHRHHPGIGQPRHSHPHGGPQQTSPKMNVRKGHNRGESLDRHYSKSLHDEPFSPLSSSGSGFSKNARLSPSPSRHHGLSALSPLQAFSPLQPTAQPLRERENHPSNNTSPERSQSGRSRKNSLTRSLSRRQSLIIHAEKWRSGMDEDWDSSADAMSLFSRLTLVKAPVEGANLRRAKSSSSIAPFSANSLDGPATTARGPRRSFAASSFAGFSPISNPASLKTLPQPFSRHGPDATNRVTGLGQEVGPQRKAMSPEEVVDIARSLMSPVAIPEGGFKGAELKRRKSAGASSYRRGSELSMSSSVSPEKPPLALEPVEYVQLDDDTLLPFVDRQAEVQELMTHSSNEKLFKQLKAAFPKAPLRQHWMALSPAEWNWDEFIHHLSGLTRVECPDYAWVFRARQAVRARSVALWEKLGSCLGCDGDLLNAGGEDGLPASWGGLGLGEEGEYDPSANQVWIEGLTAMDAREEKREAERQLKEAFGDIVEDEGEQASAGMTALLGTVGEEEEERSSDRPQRQTTAQREANKKNNPIDPMTSPSFLSRSLPRDNGMTSQSAASSLGGSPYTPHSPPKFASSGERKSTRSRSFVGLQILTSPQPQKGVFAKSPTALTPTINQAPLPMFDRDPGNPLFPSSFSSLSVEPNLGRKASVGIGGGIKAAPEGFGRGGGRWGMGGRKQSGAGLSESAITFASESDYAHSAVDEVH